MAVAHVQYLVVQNASTSAPAVTLLSDVVAGNLLAVCVILGDQSNTITSIDDTQGNLYGLAANTIDCGGHRAALAYAQNVVGGPTTITAHLSGNERVIMYAGEISGVDAINALNRVATNCLVNPGTGTDAVTSGTATTDVNGEFIIGVAVDAAQLTTLTHGTGFTAITETNDGSSGYALEYKVQTTAGSVAATFTEGSATATLLVGMMAFRPLSTLTDAGGFNQRRVHSRHETF